MVMGVITLVAITAAVLFITFRPAKAAGLTNINIALSSSSISSSSVSATITFNPNSPITNGSTLDINYDTAFTGGAALSDADVSVTGTNIVSSIESAFIAGHFVSNLTTSGTVTTAVTIAIDATPGLTNPGTAGNYTWSVTLNLGGTSTNYDSGAGLAYIGNANDVLITAQVGPTLDLQLYGQNSTTPLSAPFVCNLGTLSTTLVNSCAYDIGISTNSSTGATVKVTSDGQFRNGVNIIPACTGTNCNGDGTTGVTAGSAEYGFQITDLGTGCSTTAIAPYGTADQSVPNTAADFFTNTSICDGTTSANITKRIEVTHKASINAGTAVGTYNQLITYSIFSN
jgi:hypothetical protein